MTKRDYRRESLKSFKPYVVGKPIEEVRRELGLEGRIAKLASNENPLGVSPKALKAIRDNADQVCFYPDDNHYYFKKCVADQYEVGMDQVYVASGSVEVIEVIGATFLEPGDEVLTSQSTFAMYALGAKKAGATFIPVPMKDRYYYDLDAMVAAITPHTKVIFLANPNNPTGTWFDGRQFDAFMDKVPEGVLVIYDSAYCDFFTCPDKPDPMKHLRAGRDIMLLHTFSKTYGLAGLRIGFALGPAMVISHLNLGRVPFNASVLAQVAAIAALDDHDFVTRTLSFTKQELAFIIEGLAGLDVIIPPTQTNFILIDTRKDGQWLFLELQKRGIIVRPMGGYGFPNAVRVNVGLREDNERFVAAMQDLLAV